MEYKNYFEIEQNGRKYRADNTVLPHISAVLQSGGYVSGFIGAGTGKHPFLSGVSALAAPALIEPAEDAGGSFDLLSGAVYIKKRLFVSGAYAGNVITEAGFYSHLQGGSLVNYAVFGDGVPVGADGLYITATLYLTLPPYPFKGSLTCGFNPLFKYLLTGGPLPEFSAVLSDSGAADNRIRTGFNSVKRLPAQTYFDGNKLVFSAEPDGTPSPELLFLLDGEPFYRLTSPDASQDTVTKTFTSPCKNGRAYYPDIVETFTVASAGHKPADGQSTAYQPDVRRLPQNVGGVLKNPLGFVLKKDARIYSSPDDKVFGIINNGTLYFFDYSGKYLKPVHTKTFQHGVQNIKDIITATAGLIYFLLFNGSVKIYSIENGSLYYVADSPVKGVREMQFSCGVIIYVHSVTNPPGGICLTQKEPVYNNGSYSETVISAEIYNDVKVFCQKNGGGRHAILCAEHASLVLKHGILSLPLPSAVYQELSGADSVLFYEDYFLVLNNGKLKIIAAADGNKIPVNIESGLKKIICSPAGNLTAALYASGNIEIGIFDGKNGVLKYFSINKKIRGSITDIHFLGNTGLLVTAKTKFADTYFLPFNLSLAEVSCPAGDGEMTISTTYPAFDCFEEVSLKVGLG